jgi:hypothetical protein
MDFVIPAGSATNLPKELVDKIVHDAIEKSLVLRMVDSRDQLIEIVNEGTIPVIGEEDLDKVYRIDNTADITTLTEMSFDIKSPDLEPVELGTYIYLKKKQVAQYPELKLDQLFRNKISRAIARTADKIALKGDTGAAGATNTLTIADGIEKLANTANAANSPVEYTTSNAQNILDAVAEAQNDLGVYGSEEDVEDLVLLGSADFVTAAKKSADKDMVGYDIDDVPALGLRRVVHIHGIPLIRRLNITGEKAILANMKGAFAGYYGNIEVDVEHKAGRRADLLVVTYWFDFVWAYVNGSNKSEGLITVQKASS